MIQKCI